MRAARRPKTMRNCMANSKGHWRPRLANSFAIIVFATSINIMLMPTTRAAGPCCDQASLTFSAISQNYAEPVSMHAFVNGWRGEFAAGERAHSFSQVKALFQSTEGWRVGLRSRIDYDVRFNTETARLYYEDSNGLLDETPESPLFLSVQHLRASGVTLGYQYNFEDNWSIGLDVTRLRAHDLYEGQIAGIFSITADQEYLIDAQVDYAYQQDVLLNRPSEGATLGWGWTTDIFLRWHSEDNRWHARLDLQDAWSRITWKDTPFTNTGVNTTNQIASGSIQFEPTVEGEEGFRTQRQSLPVRTRFLMEYALGYYLTTHFTAETLPVENEWGIGLTLASASDRRHTLSATALFSVGALRLQHQYGNFYWSLGADDLNWQAAHWLKMEVGLSLYF